MHGSSIHIIVSSIHTIIKKLQSCCHITRVLTPSYGVNILIIYLRKLPEVRIFTKGHIFCHEVFFRMYLPLALEVYNRLSIDNLGFMAEDKIKGELRPKSTNFV